MKFTIERNAAIAAKTNIGRLVRGSSIPILNNYHLETGDGMVMLTASNLDVQASIDIPAHIEDPGKTTVDGIKFDASIASLPEGATLECDLSETRLHVKSGRSRFQLPILPPQDFPFLIDDITDCRFQLPGKALARLIRQGAFAYGEDKSRSYINCAYLTTIDSQEGVRLRVVSTDTYRMGVCDSDHIGGIHKGISATITPHTLDVMGSETGRLLSSEMVEIAIRPGRCVFAGSGIKIIAKQLDSKYVQYERIIPPEFNRRVIADTDLLIGLVRRSEVMSRGSSSRVRLALADQLIRGKAVDAESGGMIEDEISCEMTGEPVDFAVNAGFLLEILGHIETENVVISIPAEITKGRPMLIEPTGESDWFAILAPQIG